MAISGSSCVFADGFPVIWSGTARLPRRPAAPRNDKLDGIAPMNLCRKYCHPAGRSLSAIGSCRYCSSDSVAQGSRICHCEAPKGRGNLGKAVTILLGLFPFTALHIIENYGMFSVKILTKK